VVVPAGAVAREIDLSLERVPERQAGAATVRLELETDEGVGLALVPRIGEDLRLP
jgi:hypothetical protein